MFIDEVCFSTEKDGIRLFKRPVGQCYNAEYQNTKSSLKVAKFLGLIAYNGFGPLIQLPGRLNGQAYAEIADYLKAPFG